MEGMTMGNYDRDWSHGVEQYLTTLVDAAGGEWESQEPFDDLEDAKDDVTTTLECDKRYIKGFVSDLHGNVIFKSA